MAGEKILVVEDDTSLLEGLRDILEFAGYQIQTATNGEEALARLEAGLPQLVLSDINMPRMDGYQLFEAVRTRPHWVHVPFIYLTAKGDKSDIRRGKQLGVDDYLVKPFDEEDLLVAIRAKLDRHAQLDAAQIKQVGDLKRTILTTLNHEFRTPLTYITSYTEILRDGEVDSNSEEFKKILHGIEVGSERLRRLVEDFILLVELQSGEARRNYERRRLPTNDVAGILQEVLTKLAAQAAAGKVELTLDVPQPLPTLTLDREYFRNALRRLVENAIKFSKKTGGKVTLGAHPRDRHLILQVRDEGFGIAPENFEKIFDVFYQINRAKLEQQGSGSGLAIIREIVLLHGGTLTVQSEFGVGSTFTIELPMH